MKLTTQPGKLAFIDFETQSYEDLRRSTGTKYAKADSTYVLTAAVRIDGVNHTMGPYLNDDDLAFLTKVAKERTMVAHNATFDAAIWEHTLLLPETTWFDTLHSARAAGFPGRLEQLGRIIDGRGKDPNGERLVDMLCILKPGQQRPAVGPAHKLLLAYNVRDVELLEIVYNRVKDFGEREVIPVDAKINARGVPVCRDFLMKMQDFFARSTEDAKDRFESVAPGVNPASGKQVISWMQSNGFKPPHTVEKDGTKKYGVNKNAIAMLTANPGDFFIGDNDEDAAVEALLIAIDARRSAVRVGGSKIENALNVTESDGRARDQFVYFGAHTGRWTGRGLQLHNIPHDLAVKCDTYADVITEAQRLTEKARAKDKRAKEVTPADVCTGMLRHMIRGVVLSVADYAAVEARAVAWLADEQRMLSIFADPHASMYLDMGKHVFRRTIDKEDDPDEYILAKAMVLGCSYGMSGAKFEHSCRLRDVDLTPFNDAGISVGDAVKLYRKTYPAIPALWDAYDRAAHDAVNGVSSECHKCFFGMVGNDMHIVLPSGRPIVYRNARIEMLVPAYCKLYGMPEEPKPTVCYDSPRGFRGFLYGSKTTENICQAVCRDLVADALVKSEQESLNPFLHVHDEIAVEDDRLELLLQIMTEGPAWAKGFPIQAEGECGPVWGKTHKYGKVVFANGRRVGKP